jgi:hypothetical protein
MVILIAALLALLIGVIQFFTESITKICGRYLPYLLSFSAGVSTTYVFIHLFPHFSTDAVQTNKYLFLSVLFGFVLIHLVEKYIYQHSSEKQINHKLNSLNQITSFSYHFILGIIIYNFTGVGVFKVLLLFIPVMIFTAVRTLPVYPHGSAYIRLFVSLATLFGVLFAGFIFPDMSIEFQTALIGIIIGGLLFSVIRHSIPMGKQGKPLFFILGVCIYAPIILSVWSI